MSTASDTPSAGGGPRAVTVDGPVTGDELGFVLPHEHLTIDTTDMNVIAGPHPPGSKITMDKIGQIRRWPRSIAENALLDDDAAVIRDLKQFASVGGRTLVDVTPIGMGRDFARYRAMADASGVNIIASTGYYLSYGHRGRVAGRAVSELAEEFVTELIEGTDGTRCGVIGEIGMSKEPEPDEWKVLEASLAASRETGAPVWIHVSGLQPVNPVLDFLEKHASRVDNICICHMDYSLEDLTVHRRALSMGVNIELDLFGYPAWNRSWVFDMPTDTQRARTLIGLAADGFADQIFVSHDVCMKMQMTTYGGFGYAHILDAVGETFETLAGSRDLLMHFGVDNTRRVLCWDISEKKGS
jgi:phosphotriesterase-related protein